jgi:hypothetical protein
LWRAEPLRGAAPALPADRTDSSRGWLLGIAAALTALLAFTLAHDAFFAEPPRGAGEPAAGALRHITGKLDQVQGALRGGDQRADEGELAVVEAERAAPAAPASSVARAPTSGVPAPGIGETPEKGCNAAMAALALCQNK